MNHFKTLTLLPLAIFMGALTFNVNASEHKVEDDDSKTAAQIAEEERCTVPNYAKLIGHEELWKKHNGCPASKSNKDE